MIPADPDTLLSRRQLAAALHEKGIPIAEATLATKATRGGGPPFHRFGQRVLYRWADALTWANARLSPSYSSTSEAETLHRPRPKLLPRPMTSSV